MGIIVLSFLARLWHWLNHQHLPIFMTTQKICSQDEGLLQFAARCKILSVRWENCQCQTRSLKSATTATMVGDQRNLGGPKRCYCIFWSLFCPSNSVYGPPKIIVLSLKFHLWSPENNCFVPSNSKSVVPSKSFCPSNSVCGPPFWDLEEQEQCFCTFCRWSLCLSQLSDDTINTISRGV